MRTCSNWRTRQAAAEAEPGNLSIARLANQQLTSLRAFLREFWLTQASRVDVETIGPVDELEDELADLLD